MNRREFIERVLAAAASAGAMATIPQIEGLIPAGQQVFTFEEFAEVTNRLLAPKLVDHVFNESPIIHRLAKKR